MLSSARRVGWEELPRMSSGPAEHLGKHARPHDRRDGAAARSWEATLLCVRNSVITFVTGRDLNVKSWDVV